MEFKEYWKIGRDLVVDFFVIVLWAIVILGMCTFDLVCGLFEDKKKKEA
jgi:hypothetical protein